MIIDTGYVYFIQRGDAIKIGFSVQPERRMENLQSSHHLPLQLLGTVPASVVDEMAVHARFAHLRIRGEWFRSDRDLIQFIKTAKDAGRILMITTAEEVRRVQRDLRLWGKKQENPILKSRSHLLCRRLDRHLVEPTEVDVSETMSHVTELAEWVARLRSVSHPTCSAPQAAARSG